LGLLSTALSLEAHRQHNKRNAYNFILIITRYENLHP
jgi:hypothetical protein